MIKLEGLVGETGKRKFARKIYPSAVWLAGTVTVIVGSVDGAVK